MFRTVICFLFLFVFLIVSIPLIGIELLIGLFSKRARDISSLCIVAWAFRVICVFSGIKLEIRGQENIPKDEAVLFVSNHRSIFDVVILYGQLGKMKRLSGFVAKTETKNLPVIGWWMQLLYCKFLDRKDIKQGLKIILDCIEDVKNGISIVIYPEGTRGKGEDECEVAPFKEGSMKVAIKGGVKIIPVAMSNTRSIFEKQIPWIRSNRVVLSYGSPIDPKECSKEDLKRLGEISRQAIINDLQEINNVN
ncbi:MAG: 1-acyl-sn-glycerol-3-phosphate acyltransferase [Lachnospiraceae bacterium]|nr:1-acyl-sn-glycerol-3-phosphate acyltransferase [Lachnospiraceae bacterium]